MATAISNTKPAWQAEVTERKRWIIEEFVDVSRPNGDEVQIRFRVNRRNDRAVSFTDYREQGTGTAGTTGIWGTLPPQRAARHRTLTLTAFRSELTILVGAGRADEIVESLEE